jgi:hypothetical protein
MGFAPSPKFSFCASSAQLAGTDNVTLAVIAFATDLIKQFGPAARIFIGGLHSAQVRRGPECSRRISSLVDVLVTRCFLIFGSGCRCAPRRLTHRTVLGLQSQGPGQQDCGRPAHRAAQAGRPRRWLG